MDLWFKCCKNCSCSCSCIFSNEIASGVWEVIMAGTVLYKISKKHMAAFALEATSHFGQTWANSCCSKFCKVFFNIMCSVSTTFAMSQSSFSFRLAFFSTDYWPSSEVHREREFTENSLHSAKSLWIED